MASGIVIKRSPYTPYSIYLRGAIGLEGFERTLSIFPFGEVGICCFGFGIFG